MTFFAKIKPKSHVETAWKDRSAIGGYLHGVKFVLIKGIYESEGPVPDEAVESLMAHNSVIVEAVAVAPNIPE